MNKFFEENHKLIFREWISPEELKNATVLDLGCQTGWLGEYCTDNNVSEYIGVDICQYSINKARYDYPKLTFVLQDLEDYLKESVNKQLKFDIVVISRTIQGIHNLVEVLENVAKITNKLVLEIGVPVNFAAHRLLEMVKELDISGKYNNEIQEIKNYIEYKHQIVEYITDDFVNVIPSIGYFNDIMSRLGFKMSLETYETVKEKYPTEYGYFFKNAEADPIGKAIIKFIKVDNIIKPITWTEWNNIK